MSDWPRSMYARLLIGPELPHGDERYTEWRIRHDDLMLVKREARADLAARIEARVSEWPIGPALREHGWQDAVLAAIRKEGRG